MKVSKYHQQGDSGLYNVGKVITDELGWIFRPQENRDYGIDALVEVVENNQTRGELLALQIKSGQSWLKEQTKEGYIHRNDTDHLDYWSEYPIPVLIIIHDPSDNSIYWQIINKSTICEQPKGWKILLPFTNRLDKENTEKLHSFCLFKLSNKSYSVLSFKDMSHGVAKRYSAEILLNRNLSNGEIVQLINSLTNELKERNYYRNEIVSKRWRKEPASVIWLCFYITFEDSKNSNWICRSQWIDKRLEKRFSPLKEKGLKIGDELVVIWSNLYDTLSKLYEDEITKEDFMIFIAKVLTIANNCYNRTKKDYANYINKKIDNQQFEKLHQKLISQFEEVNDLVSFRDPPPLECKEIDQLVSQMICSIHNVRIVFMNQKNGINSIKNRDYLINMYLNSYEEEMKKFEYERSKL